MYPSCTPVVLHRSWGRLIATALVPLPVEIIQCQIDFVPVDLPAENLDCCSYETSCLGRLWPESIFESPRYVLYLQPMGLIARDSRRATTPQQPVSRTCCVCDTMASFLSISGFDFRFCLTRRPSEL